MLLFRENFKAASADVKGYDVHSIPKTFGIPVYFGIADSLVQRRLLLLPMAVSFSTSFPVSGAGLVSLVGIGQSYRNCVKEHIPFLESVWSHSNG